MVEKTLFFVKPDGMRRDLDGECLLRIKRKGLRVIASKLTMVSPGHARKHYKEHKGKPFFAELVEFVTSGPVLAFVFEGTEAVSKVRLVLGSAHDAPPGTIRGDFATSMAHNVAHASDSLEAAAREIPLFFKKSEFIEWELDSGQNISE